MDLIAPLTALAGRWVEEQVKTSPATSLKTLAVRSLGDAKTFERIAEGRTITVATYEKLVDFLATPANWPASVLPDDVARRLMMMKAVSLAA